MKSIFNFFLFAFCLFAGVANAQNGIATANENPDYIITTSGDTIACVIRKPIFKDTPVYQIGKEGKSKRLLLSAVKEYYTSKDSTIFMAVHKNGNRNLEFMRVIEKGKINLFEEINTYYSHIAGSPLYSGFSSTTTKWYISKGTNVADKLKTSELFFNKSKQKRKNQFVEMISDNQTVLDKYNADDSFGFGELRTIVHLYNTGEWVTEFKR